MKYLIALFLFFQLSAQADLICPEPLFYKVNKTSGAVQHWEPTGKELRDAIPLMNSCYKEIGLNCAYLVMLLPDGKLYIECGDPLP